LHTILSTEIVHKSEQLGGAVGHAAGAPSVDLLPMLHNCAEEKFPYKSRRFDLEQGLAHNFIHRTCAELDLLHCFQLATLPHSLLIRFSFLLIILQEFTCSLFFKPQAGPSGHC
jgi:hypothetical protein